MAGAHRQHRQLEGEREQTMRAVRRSLEAGDAAAAVALLQAAPEVYFKNPDFQELSARCRQDLERATFVRSALDQFEKLAAGGRLEPAAALLTQALQTYPTDPALLSAQVRLRLEQQKAKLLERLNEAKAAVGRMEYKRAIEIVASLTPSLVAVPELAGEVQALEQEARFRDRQQTLGRDAIAKANEGIRQGEYAGAIATLEKAATMAGPSPEIDDVLQSARAQREERILMVLNEARALLGAENFEDALLLLAKARTNLGAQEIDSLASTVREKQRQFERKREETLDQARQFLAAGDAGSAMALLDAAPKACLKNDEFTLVYTACRRSLDRGKLVSSAVARIEALLDGHGPAQAKTLLDSALREYPGEPTLLTLQTRVQREESRLRRMEWVNQVEKAKAALGRAEYKQALEILKSLPLELTQSPDDLVTEVLALQEQARQQEQQSILRQQALRDATEQVRKKQFTGAIETLEKAQAVVGASAEVDSLLQLARDQQRRERDRQRDHLLAIEQKVSATKSSKLKSLNDQVQQIVASYSSDEEIAAIASRIGQRIAAGTTASAVPRQPLPWGRVALGIAVAAAAAAALKLGPSLFHTPSVPVEIHSEPPGASVRIAERSCIAPNCRFDLPPGRYQIQAQLDGFVPVQQTLVLDAAKRNPLVNLTLQPVVASRPPTLPLPKPVVPGTGMLEVQAGLPNALVYVDNTVRGHTDSQGVFSAPIEARSHRIRVEKDGYQTPREQQADIARNGSLHLVFNLAPRVAKLDLRGAPAGVEIRLGTTSLGRTDGLPSFAVSVPPGDQTLVIAQGPATRQIARQFAPDQTQIVDWQSVAPKPPISPPPPPNTGELEAQDWERVRNAPDATQLDGFLVKYPNGPHAAEAQSKLQYLVWERTNRDDVAALQAYLNRFPAGPHSGEASRRIDDILWSKVGQRDREALRKFIAQYPNSPHHSEAQSLVSQLDKPQEPPNKPPSAADQQAISAVLGQFNAAFEHRQSREVKQVWPTVPDRYIQAMRVAGATFEMVLRPTGEPEVNGDAASVPCQLITRTTVSGGQPSQKQITVAVTLRKNGDRWTIVNPLGAP